MRTYFIMAVRNLLQARRRTILLSTALALVSMLLVILMALSAGLTDTMIRAATLLTAGHVNVAGFYKAKPGDALPLVTNVSKIREIVENNVEGLETVIDRCRGWGKMISESSSMQVAMSGIDVAEETALLQGIQLAKESDYKEGGRDTVVGDPHELSEPNTVMIFSAQAKRLGVGVGDVVTMSTESITGYVNTIDVRVVAVAKDVGFMSNWNCFVPKQVIRELYQFNDDTSGNVMVFLDDIERAPEVRAKLSQTLEAAGYRVMEYQADPFWRKFTVVSGEDWTGQKLDLTLWEDEVNYMKWTLTALDTVSYFLVAILTLIIIVGIMNTMWIAVRERTQEIGTLRAIGMSRPRVLMLFMTEALVLALFATSLGSLLGAGIAYGVDAMQWTIEASAVQAVLLSDTLNLSVEPLQLVRGVATFTVVTMLASLWPALRAARMQPVTAIHNVG